MLKLALLVWGLASQTVPAVATTEESVCDDGSPAWDSQGQPNWSCTIEGCSPHEQVCWDYRLEHCFDETGRDLGTCTYQKDECSGRVACFNLWVHCGGAYVCHSDTVFGCTNGTCTDTE